MNGSTRSLASGLAVLVVWAAFGGVAVGQDTDVVNAPRESGAALERLDDGTPVWVVRQPSGRVEVLAVGVGPVPPDASPFAWDSAVAGVRAPVAWVPGERSFLGGSVVFDATGRAFGWFPRPVGGAENAEPVEVRDLDAYDVERVDNDRVRVGPRRAGAPRTVPANPDFPTLFPPEELVSPVRGPAAAPLTSVADALARPAGTVVLVDGDVVVDGLTPPRVCAVPRVPVNDLPPCPDDGPEPPDVTARDPDPLVYVAEHGPYLVRTGGGTFRELIGGAGSAGRLHTAPPPGGFDGDPSTVERVDGPTPAELGVAVSRERFRDGEAHVVVLARDDVAADATTGAVLTRDGPLLFTGRDALPQATLDELDRVLTRGDPEVGTGPGRVLLLGGPAAISEPVERRLSDAGHPVVRLAGPTRVETSIAIAGASRVNGPNGAIVEVALARADGSPGDPTQAWADAVAAGGWSAASRTPVLLSPGRALHPAVAQALTEFRTTSTVLLGGSGALSEQVEAAVPSPRRVAGSDRTATAAAVAEQLWSARSSRVVLFDGYGSQGWVAALAGAGLAADFTAPLLVGGDPLPAATRAEINRGCDWRRGEVLVVGAAAVPGAADDCPPDATEDVALEVTVDAAKTVVATLRNDTTASLTIALPAVVADVDRVDDGTLVFAPVLSRTGRPTGVGIDPGQEVEVLRSAPFPSPPGRYRVAVHTSDGIARTDFFIEFP